MLIACWSVKGGSGTTVVACSLAVILARRSSTPAVLADLAGDAPAALGLPEPSGPGLFDWVAAGPDVPGDGLGRLAVDAAPNLTLLPRGTWSRAVEADATGAARLSAALAERPFVVADCGTLATEPALTVAAEAPLSMLVLRPCYLALRRALHAPFRPSAVVLLGERDRALTAQDVEDTLGVPVRAVVPVDAGIARAVDAGLLASRLPRHLSRALDDAA